MGDNLKWIFELVDRVTGPAKKMTTATEGFDSELKKVKAQIDKIKMDPQGFKALMNARKELSKIKADASGIRRGGGVLSTLTSLRNIEAVRLIGDGLQFAYRSARAVIGAMASIGERIAAAAGEQERYNIAFKGMLGPTQGAEVLGFLDKLSVKTELTHSKIQELAARVVTAGFKGNDVGKVLAGALDAASYKGGGVENVEGAISALERLKLTGEVSSRSLLSIGLSEQQVFKRITADTGKTQKEIQEQVRSGAMSTIPIVQAVLEELSEKEHGPLGTMAEKMGTTLSALMTHLGELPDRYFQKLSNSPGMDKAKTALSSLLMQLDPNSPTGTKILASLNTAISSIATKFSSMLTPENIAAATNEISTLIDDLGKIPAIVDKIISGIEIFGTLFVASKLVTGITALTGAIGIGAAPVILAAAAFVSLANAIALVVRNKRELGDDFDFIIHGMHHAVSKGNAGHAALVEQNERNLAVARSNGLISTAPSASAPAPSMAVPRGVVAAGQTIHVGAVHFDGTNIKDGEEAARQFQSAMSRPGTLQSGTALMSLESGAG